MMEYEKKIGSRLKRIRETRRLTIKLVSDEIGYTKEMIRIVENGTSRCNLDMYYKLCQCYETSMNIVSGATEKEFEIYMESLILK